MRNFYLSFFLLPFFAFSQKTINGTLLDSESQEPIAYAHVFLSDSSKGTFSDLDGSFSLTSERDFKNPELVISHVGFELKTVKINSGDVGLIKLKAKKDKLLDVEVSSGVDKKWRREYELFKEAILGSTPFAEKCKILNPWVIDFSKVKEAFLATADKPIEIANDALGYRISFRLDFFSIINTTVFIKGHPTKVRNLSANEQQRIEFDRNRQKAYEGSVYHFAQCLANDSLDHCGYEAYFVGYELTDIAHIQVQKNLIENRRVTHRNRILTKRGSENQFDFDGFLQVIYTNPITEKSEESWIKQNGDAFITEKGVIENLDNLKLYGSFSNDRLANYLPLAELKPYYKKQLKTKSIADKIRSKFPENNLNEKVYLHTDREVYYAGEDIWLKGYINPSENGAVQSRKLYVELINKDSSITQTIISIEDGKASGYLTIPNSLTDGPYMIASYTDLNAKYPDSHFKKPIQIGYWEAKTIRNSNDSGTISIFPEGGELIARIVNNVAFEIKDSKGNRMNGELSLYEGNKKLTNAKTDWAGKGSFKLIPKENVRYSLKGNELNLTPHKFSASTKEIGIIVQNTVDGFRVNLQSNVVISDSIYIVTSCKNKLQSIHHAFLYKTYQLMILNEDLNDGVNVITIFDKNINPLLERVMYKPPTIVGLGLNVSSQDLQTRVTIAGQDSIKSASLSIIDLSKSNDRGIESILVTNYLRPEIKGMIQNADQIFFEPNEKNIDFLMLKNGLRNFNENIELTNETIQKELIAGFQINGSIDFKKAKKAHTDTIYLINRKSKTPLLSEIVDEKGQFSFDNVSYTDSTSLFFAFDKKYAKNVSSINLTADHDWQYISGYPFKFDFSDELLNERRKLNFENYIRSRTSFNTSEATLLEEVVVLGEEGSSLKSRKYSITSADILSFKEKPLAGFGITTYTAIQRLQSVEVIIYYEVGGAIIRDVKLINSEVTDPLRNEIDLFIDNSFSEPITLLYMNPANIERIEFVKLYGKNGSLFVYTREITEKKSNRRVFQKRLKGFQEKKDFYTEKLLQNPSHQSATLHWDPSISNDQRSISFSVPQKQIPMKIILEGFTKDNKPFRLTKTYHSN